MGNKLVYNRIVIAIALLILIPALVVIIMLSLGGSRSSMYVSEEARMKYVRDYTEKLNGRNADIIFYKQDPNGPDNLKARRVNALNDKGLALNLYNDSAYHILILNDLNGTLNLNDQEIQKIKDLLTNQHFHIIYLGSKYYKKFVSEGLFNSSINHKEDTKSYLVFVNKHGARSCAEGFADSQIDMPVTSGITEEQKVIYTVVMELALKEFYFN